MNQSNQYRPDIDGLRAVAVLSVVTFHAFPGILPGGFIGVDIFFVISGYLISTILITGLRNESFSILEFYARRIRRIFPALLLVLIACIVVASKYTLIDEFRQLGKHIVGASTFLSNIILRDEAGYFDTSADTKPLLHLWSLGIEEQFYLLWPFILWAAWRAKINLLAVTGGLIAISFGLNVSETNNDLVSAFFSPQTRFWELLAGALLAIRNNQAIGKTFSNTLGLIGSALIIVGVFALSKNVVFPGWWATIPVVGAILVIQAGRDAWINRLFLSHPLAVWMGLISYPLYLWHWPILAFLRINQLDSPGRTQRLLAVALSILLAWITYALVEKPIRFGSGKAIKSIMLGALMAIIGLTGFAMYSAKNPSLRAVPKDIDAFVDAYSNAYPDWRYFKSANLNEAWRSECAFFDRETYMKEGKLKGGAANSKPVTNIASTCYTRDPLYPKAVMIWGDSHAQVLSSGIRRNIPNGWQVLQVASAGCAPAINVTQPSRTRQCDQSNYFAMQTIATARPDVVVVAQATDHSISRMQAISAKLHESGVKKVLFVGPQPIWTDTLPKIIARHLWPTPPQRTFIGVNQDFIKANEALKASFTGFSNDEYIDSMSLFCDEKGCLTRIGGDLVSWDEEHLTPKASNYLAQHVVVSKIIEK